jgi:hypothetical protein
MNPDTYLGGGVYASHDGYQIRLYTVRADGTHELFLDAAMLARLERFVADLRARACEGF